MNVVSFEREYYECGLSRIWFVMKGSVMKGSVMNGSVMNMVCHERVCYKCGLL